MILKRSPVITQINATAAAKDSAANIKTTATTTTTTSIWERLPYNIGMELHSFPNENAIMLQPKKDKNFYSSSNNCCQQQQLHNFNDSPPPQELIATAITLNKDLHLHCSAVAAAEASETLLSTSLSSNRFSSSVGFQQRQHWPVATNNILQQRQQLNNKFPVDYSNTTNSIVATTTTILTAATNLVVMQLKPNQQQQQQKFSLENVAKAKVATNAKNTTTSTTTTLISSRCCFNEDNYNNNNSNIIGDIPLECNASRSNNNLSQLPPHQMLQLQHQQHQHKDAILPTLLRRFILVLVMLSTVTQCWARGQDALSNCTFPARWEGSWFLSGYQQSIHIKGSQFSYRGKCAASDGNKYLIVDEKGCHRCLVIYEKHKNVLQYKESECEGDSMYLHQSNPSAMAMRSVLKQNGDHSRGGAHPNSNGHSRLSSSDQYIMRSNDDMNDYFCKGRETLQNLCDQIPGDALLYSLFRESAEPVKCPLKGPFVFTYNRGHGECKSPVSNIDSCTEDSRLLLSFQACPDVQGTESTVEELTCLATWKDGNSRYLVGLVSHHHAISNEERYRCFVYEKISSLMGGPGITSLKDAEYKLAQSGDATCNGLDSAEVGSRIMSLRKPPPAERCDFPAWFKGPRHWHALMGNAVYNYHSNDGSMHIIKPNGYMETRALCEQINKQTSTEMMAVVHYTTGCQSGFMCMMFYRRDTHVIEIQTGKQASRLEDACAPDHFDINRMPYITLLANNPDPQICPLEGLYNLRGAIGPPYISSRHKRNHNYKGHSGHGHHHLQQQQQQHELDAIGIGGTAAISESNGGSGYKRHNTLSFRNSEEIEHSSWHSHTRGLPIRSRRAAPTTTTSTTTTTTSAIVAIDVATDKANDNDKNDFTADDDDDNNETANDSVLETKQLMMKKTTGKKFHSTHLNVGNAAAAAAAKTMNDNYNNNKSKKYHNNRVGFEETTRIGGNHLSKLPVSSNSNSNNSKNNKWQQHQRQQQHQQLKTKATEMATEKGATFADIERSAMNAKMSSAAEAAAAASAPSTTAMQRQKNRLSATELEVVSGIINADANNVDDALPALPLIVVDAAAAAAAGGADSKVATTHNNHVTFIASSAIAQQRSRRDAPGCIVNYKAQRQLWIGCTAPNLIDVRPQCNDDGDEEYSCHGSWSENGTVFIIARHKGTKHGVCISYRPLEGTTAKLVIGDACYRGEMMPAEHHLVANLTVFGKCGDTSAARSSLLHSRGATATWWTTLMKTLAATVMLLNQLHCNFFR